MAQEGVPFADTAGVGFPDVEAPCCLGDVWEPPPCHICMKVGCFERAPAPYNTKHKAGAGIQAACSPQADAVVTE